MSRRLSNTRGYAIHHLQFHHYFGTLIYHRRVVWCFTTKKSFVNRAGTRRYIPLHLQGHWFISPPRAIYFDTKLSFLVNQSLQTGRALESFSRRKLSTKILLFRENRCLCIKRIFFPFWWSKLWDHQSNEWNSLHIVIEYFRSYNNFHLK